MFKEREREKKNLGVSCKSRKKNISSGKNEGGVVAKHDDSSLLLLARSYFMYIY